jgi:putative chitinase
MDGVESGAAGRAVAVGERQMYISQNVGLDAPNQNDDVTLIQALLNLNLSLLPGVPFLAEDGVLGPHSLAVIQQFQSLVATPGAASGVIDPGGATLAALRAAVNGQIGSNLLHVLMPLSSQEQADTFAAPLVACMNTNQINTALRQAHFLAQLGHESGSLRYTAELASGAAYEGRIDLGNAQPGDGPRFKGRGLIQITGRTNYTNYSNDRGQDYITGLNPNLLAADPSIAADCSGWFWATRHLNELADHDDLLTITKRINGGTNGLDDRARRLKLAKCLLIP